MAPWEPPQRLLQAPVTAHLLLLLFTSVALTDTCCCLPASHHQQPVTIRPGPSQTCAPVPHRRKVEIMHTHSLFTLLGERLMMHTNTVSITTYNTLYEVTPLPRRSSSSFSTPWCLLISSFSSPTCRF